MAGKGGGELIGRKERGREGERERKEEQKRRRSGSGGGREEEKKVAGKTERGRWGTEGKFD